MVEEIAVLALPGTMFNPQGLGARHLRIAFANIDTGDIAVLFERLARLTGARV